MDSGKVLQWVTAVAMPLAVALLGYFQNRSIQALTKEGHDKDVAIKFIELTWSAINSNDTIAARNALRVLATIDDKVAARLAVVAFPASQVEEPQRAALTNLHAGVADVGLDQSTITIWYNDPSTAWEATTCRVVDSLVHEMAPHAFIERETRSMKRPPRPGPCVLLYSPGKELAARRMQEILARSLPHLPLQLEQRGGFDVLEASEIEVYIRDPDIHWPRPRP